MSVSGTAFHSHEQVTGPDRAAIDGNPCDGNVRDIQHAERQGNFCEDVLKGFFRGHR